MKAKKIISRIATVLTVISFLFGLTIFVCVLQAKKGEVPQFLGFSVMQIKTGSMEPEYKIGAVIITKKVEPETLKKGDVISFYTKTDGKSQQVNTHRIDEVSFFSTGEREFYTKGDANELRDFSPVLHSSVIGKVVLNLGVFSGSVISVLQNPKVIFFLIILPLLFITFSEAVNLVNLFMKRNQPEEEQLNESECNKKNKSSD